MGIEYRKGRPYLYRKERTPDGVRSVYVGPMSSPVCRLAVDYDRARQMERAAFLDSLRPLDLALAEARQHAANLRPFVSAFMLATGHRSHRGQWRAARHLRPFLPTVPPLTPGPMSDSYTVASDYGEHARIPTTEATPTIEDAIAACDSDNPTGADVSRLRDALVAMPRGHWRGAFTEAAAVRSLSQLVVGASEPCKAAALVEAEAVILAEELAGGGGPLVKAAAAQAAQAQMILSAVSNRYGRAVSGSYNIDHAAAMERRMDAAQRRYLRALATVAGLQRAEGAEAGRAAKMERHAGASRPGPMDLHRFLPAPSGDSLPAPADLTLVAG